MENILFIVLLLGSAYWISLVMYRVFLSPLRSVPGSLLGRFSVGWHLWHTYNGDYHIAMREVHRKYGRSITHISYTFIEGSN